MKKKIFAFAMAAALSVSAAGATSLVVDGTNVQTDVPPVIVDGRTLVPVRALFESLGATVGWEESTQTATATKGSTVISMQIGNTTAYVNGVAKTLDVPAQTIEGRTMAPARFVAESLNAQVDWKSSTDTVYISTTDNYNGYRLAPKIIYSTPAEENGYGDTFMYADGIISNVQTANGYDYRILSTKDGTIAIVNVFYIPSFYNLADGQSIRSCFQYLGYSDVLNMATGVYMEIGNASQPTMPPKKTQPSTVETTESKDSSNQSRTVYITKTGKRYHYDNNCNGGTYYPSTLSEAQSRGLTPCNKCVN